MTPIRIIIIGILLYLGYRLIVGGKKKEVDTEADEQFQEKQAVEDVLVEDPICHNLVPKRQAVQLKDENTIVYFCSQKCCDKYVDEKKGEE